MRQELRELVRSRARGHCEYCHFPEAFAFLPFQLDHIIAEKHLGPSIESNLAWSCYYCNSYKGPNISGWNPATDEVVPLFHPRRDDWDSHFYWHGALLVGRTTTAAVTIGVLNINHPDALAIRQQLPTTGQRLV